MLTTLVNLILSLVYVKSPALIERIGLGKKGAVVLAFINLCAWVPLILAFLLSQMGITPGWFALLWCANLMPALLLSAQRDNWLSNLVPHNFLGGYLGQRLAIRSAFYLGAFCFMGYFLDAFEGAGLSGFAFIFILAMAAALVEFIIFTFIYEPRVTRTDIPEGTPVAARFGLFDYFREIKEGKLGTFVTFTSLFYLSAGLCGPLYAIYMLQELHFSYLSFTMIISAEFLARIISVPLWGRSADRAGNISVLGIVSRIIPLIPICWLFSPGLVYLVLIQVISGICWGAYDLCTQSYIYKIAPQQKKLRYIIYTRSLIMLSTALGGLGGAYLIDGIFPTFGSKILSIFLISGIFRALVVMYLIPRLVDLAISFDRAPAPPKADLEILNRAIASRRGLFYRYQPATEYSAVLKRQTAVESSTSHHRRNWAKPEALVLSKNETIKHPATSRRVFYRHPETWAGHLDRMTAATQKQDSGKPGLRTGIYHDAVGWANYMKGTLKAIIKDKKVNFAPLEEKHLHAFIT